MLTSKHFLHLLYHPSDFLLLRLSERSDFIIILRQQKLLARFAYQCIDENILEDLDPSSQRHLRNAIHITERLEYQVVQEAKGLKDVLKNHSSFVVFLKGAAYTLSNSAVARGRSYGDIDILIEKSALSACEKTLAVEGWFGQEISDYDDKYYRHWAHEIPPLMHMQRGTVIDVHHNIIPIISNDAPTVSSLASYIVVNEHGLQVLSPAAQFVHSAVHLFRNEEYDTAFRDVQDLYLMLIEGNDEFIENVLQVANTLNFEYETGLALYFVKHIFSKFEKYVAIDDAIVQKCLNKRSRLRVSFDLYVFDKVLLPQHDLLKDAKWTVHHFLALIRGHCIKMPLHLLGYHLIVKSARTVIESIFGKHVFTPKDEQSEKQKY